MFPSLSFPHHQAIQTLFQQEKEPPKKKNPIKTGLIVIVTITLLMMAVSYLSLNGTIPLSTLGGPAASYSFLGVGAIILPPSAYMLYKRW